MADDLIRDAREAYEAGVRADQHNTDEMRVDLEFAAGDQWPAEIKSARQAEKRPLMKFPMFSQYVNQVTGDIRLNPPGVMVRAVDGGADPKTAKTFTGLIRNIEAASNAKIAYVTAVGNAAWCGQGFFRVGYDYVGDSSFDMELTIDAIRSPFAVVCDPASVEPTMRDAEWCFVTDLVPEADFERRWPKAKLDGWDNAALSSWREGDFIRVAQWWRKVPSKKRLVQTHNGSVFDITGKDDDEIDEIAALAGGVARVRMVDSHKIEMRLLNGNEELEDKYEWPGYYLPIIRVVGQEVNLGDRVVRSGLVRNARDAQSLYNIQRTAYAESVAMTPKAKWLATWAQVGPYFDKFWAVANTSNVPVLPYAHDPQAPGPPQRIAAEVPNAALLQDMQLAVQDVERTIGMYRESIGKETNAQSGKAIISRQREGDVGTFLYMDNLADSVAHCGRILVDILPKVYDTARVVRVLGADANEEYVPINTVGRDGKKMNDLSAGRYDVVPSVGPSFSTQREEARESMMNYFAAQPAAAELAGDLFAKSMEWPGAEELAARLRNAALAKGIIDPDPKNEEDMKFLQAQKAKGPQQSPEMELAKAEAAKAQASMFKAETDRMCEIERLKVEQSKLTLEAQRVQLEMQKLAIVGAEAEADIEATRTGTGIKKFEALKGVLDTHHDRVAERMDRMEQAKAAPAVGIQLGPDMERAMAQSMDRSAEAMTAMAEATRTIAGAVQQSNAQMMGMMEHMAHTAAAPRRLVRDPKTQRAIGVEIVRN